MELSTKNKLTLDKYYADLMVNRYKQMENYLVNKIRNLENKFADNCMLFNVPYETPNWYTCAQEDIEDHKKILAYHRESYKI